MIDPFNKKNIIDLFDLMLLFGKLDLMELDCPTQWRLFFVLKFEQEANY